MIKNFEKIVKVVEFVLVGAGVVALGAAVVSEFKGGNKNG